MSSQLAVGGFVRLDGKSYIAVRVASEVGERVMVIVDVEGNERLWAWSEMSDGRWPVPLGRVEPGKDRGALNKQLEKYKRRQQKVRG